MYTIIDTHIILNLVNINNRSIKTFIVKVLLYLTILNAPYKYRIGNKDV